jgi:hypothetical protein
MVPTIEALIAKAERLVRTGEEAVAMATANELIEQYPHDARPWSLRSYLFSLRDDYPHAIADLTRAIQINDLETDFFFNRVSTRSRFKILLAAWSCATITEMTTTATPCTFGVLKHF